MPMAYRVDHAARLVIAAGHGILTDADVFGYQREVWSRDDVAGYDELVDMTRVIRIDLPSADRIRDLATMAAAADHPAKPSKFAVVAPEDLAFGLGRMFQAYRESDSRSTKEVGIFRTLEQACAFLGVELNVATPELP